MRRRPAWATAGPSGSPPDRFSDHFVDHPWFVAAKRHDRDRDREPRWSYSRDMRWGGFGGWPSGGRRARRGDVRAAVLVLLDERPMHGYEIIQELSARTSGAWRPSPGSVYPTLQLLEDSGLVRGTELEGKRVVELTDAGRAELAVVRERVGDAPWEVFDEAGPRHQLKESLIQLAAAVVQVARAGDQEQTAQVVEILRDARKRIYSILAD
jgi:DNA-binding PadR family transcriptional regulator